MKRRREARRKTVVCTNLKQILQNVGYRAILGKIAWLICKKDIWMSL